MRRAVLKIANVAICAVLSIASAGAGEPERAALRQRLDQAMLKAGLPVNVIAANRALGPLLGGPYPSLILQGPMTRAAVYQIATATDIIAAAREAGFRSVEFSNAPYGGQWLFDLTKAGKACAADLCF